MPLLFLVELGAAMMLASTAVPALSSKPRSAKRVGDGGKDSGGQLVAFQQVTEAQNADPIGDTIHATKACKLAVQRHVKQRLFHGHVTQAKPLLQKVDAQHGLGAKGWTSSLGPDLGRVRLNERDKLRPRHHRVHLLQEHLLALLGKSAARDQAHLFHGVIVSSSAGCSDDMDVSTYIAAARTLLTEQHSGASR